MSFLTRIATASRSGPTLLRSLHTSSKIYASPPARASAKQEGTIASVFASLSGEAAVVLPERFAELKRTIVPDEHAASQVTAAWEEVLDELRLAEKEIVGRGSDVILSYHNGHLHS